MAKDETTLTEEQILQAELEALQAGNEAARRREHILRLRRDIEAEKRIANKAEVEAKVLETLGDGAKRDIDYRFVEIDDRLVVVKRPHELHYRKFRDSEKTDAVSCEQFIKPSIVYPTKEEFRAMCSEVPAIADEAAGAGLFLCGVRQKVKEGK